MPSTAAIRSIQHSILANRHCDVSRGGHDGQGGDPGELLRRGAVQGLPKARVLGVRGEREGDLSQDQHALQNRRERLLRCLYKSGETHFVFKVI